MEPGRWRSPTGMRALRSPVHGRARTGLLGPALLPMDDTLLHAAARLQPPDLRWLDAIHLATAITIRDSLGVVFCYDRRLADAAESAGLPVARPGA